MTSVQEKNCEVANTQLAAKLYGHLLTTTSGNLLCSPLVVQLILSLIYPEAQQQLTNNSEEIEEIIKKIGSQLQNNKDYKLSIANKIYTKTNCEIKDDFKRNAIKNFNVEFEIIDLGKKELTVIEMNKWVEKKTKNKIKNLISSDSIYKNTNIVLINIANFCGKWEKAFAKYLTNKCPFHINNETTIDVNMMRQKDFFRYYESSELDAKFLEMTYEGEDVSVNFVLPNDKEGLSNLEGRILDIFAEPQYCYYDVLVVIPKFEIETEIEIKSILEKLSIATAFGDNAESTNTINTAIQKVFIDVDERGTTAAPPTDWVMDLPEDSCIIEPKPLPAEFIADHPFLFYIKYKDVILFVGRYISPTKLS